MNKTELAHALWARVSKTDLSAADLLQLLQDYKAAISDIRESGPAYRAALRSAQEELPDLERIAGRKHDAILKGRLADAISVLKTQVQAIGEGDKVQEHPQTPGSEPRVRNMPNLGME